MADKTKTYREQLLDPRWQRMRLEVMQRDGFACRHCADSENTLNVHHTYYKWGSAPWEYPQESLVTLCVTCHGAETHAQSHFKELIQHAIEAGFTYGELAQYMSGLVGSAPEYNHADRVALASFAAHSTEVLDFAKKVLDRNANEWIQSEIDASHGKEIH